MNAKEIRLMTKLQHLDTTVQADDVLHIPPFHVITQDHVAYVEVGTGEPEAVIEGRTIRDKRVDMKWSADRALEVLVNAKHLKRILDGCDGDKVRLTIGEANGHPMPLVIRAEAAGHPVQAFIAPIISPDDSEGSE